MFHEFDSAPTEVNAEINVPAANFVIHRMNEAHARMRFVSCASEPMLRRADVRSSKDARFYASSSSATPASSADAAITPVGESVALRAGILTMHRGSNSGSRNSPWGPFEG